MSYPSMAFNIWKWVFFLLSPLLFFFGWKLVVKPYEIKRLQQEAVLTANKLVDGFSARSLENLASIEALFTDAEKKQYKAYDVFIDDLNSQFQKIHGLESFILPPVGDGSSALVLFNPYTLDSQGRMAKETCDEALITHANQLKMYRKMTLIPMDGILCVYSPRLHMFAVLNLKTTLKEHLKKERMKGYFLALMEGQLPELIPSAWDFSWIHSKQFSFLGTEWKIHVYPSGAYIKSSFRGGFRLFLMAVAGCLGLFLWWGVVLRQKKSVALDPNYVAHLKQLALFDGVTNLPNRRHCLDHLNTVLKRAMRRHAPFSVCFMDCDGFKIINDKYGHHVGDLVLRHIADEVSQVIRGNDFFARFSGDEFCLILEDTTDEKGLAAALSKLLEVVATPIFTGEHTISVTMSIGVAVYPEAGQSVDTLLKHADEAMYTAKHYKKNTYVIYQA
ncbi:MAG: GGDEF domain-containing protein [Legionellaceae bacterium]|nr:GGDEF domain-containing protein [Legionellaceae bacterium]